MNREEKNKSIAAHIFQDENLFKRTNEDRVPFIQKLGKFIECDMYKYHTTLDSSESFAVLTDFAKCLGLEAIRFIESSPKSIVEAFKDAGIRLNYGADLLIKNDYKHALNVFKEELSEHYNFDVREGLTPEMSQFIQGLMENVSQQNEPVVMSFMNSLNNADYKKPTPTLATNANAEELQKMAQSLASIVANPQNYNNDKEHHFKQVLEQGIKLQGESHIFTDTFAAAVGESIALSVDNNFTHWRRELSHLGLLSYYLEKEQFKTVLDNFIGTLSNTDKLIKPKGEKRVLDKYMLEDIEQVFSQIVQPEKMEVFEEFKKKYIKNPNQYSNRSEEVREKIEALRKEKINNVLNKSLYVNYPLN